MVFKKGWKKKYIEKKEKEKEAEEKKDSLESLQYDTKQMQRELQDLKELTKEDQLTSSSDYIEVETEREPQNITDFNLNKIDNAFSEIRKVSQEMVVAIRMKLKENIDFERQIDEKRFQGGRQDAIDYAERLLNKIYGFLERTEGTLGKIVDICESAEMSLKELKKKE